MPGEVRTFLRTFADTLGSGIGLSESGRSAGEAGQHEARVTGQPVEADPRACS